MSATAKRNIANFVMLNTAWCVAVISAAKGMDWVGPIAVLILLAVHLWMMPNRAREVVMVVVVGVAGCMGELLLIQVGVVHFPTTDIWIGTMPLWIFSLWLMFAASMSTSLKWLQGRYVIAAVLGGVSGPLSYRAGQALGAVELHQDPTMSWGLLGLVWGVMLASVIWLARRLTLTGR